MTEPRPLSPVDKLVALVRALARAQAESDTLAEREQHDEEKAA